MRRWCLTLVLLALATSPAIAQVPAGPEFLVNTYTTGDQKDACAAVDRSGRFTITWTGVDAASSGVRAQRFAADGARIGGEFLVPTITSGSESLPSVAYGATGSSVVAWQGGASAPFDIRAQRYAPGGAPRGGEFVVSTSANALQPRVVALRGGGFAVAWSSPAAADNRIVTRSFDDTTNTFGATQTLVAAGTDGLQNYYPSYSPDGQWIVFTRTGGTSYNSFDAETWVVKADGTKPPVKLQIAGLPQGSLTNSWARWVPFGQTFGASGEPMFYLTFSSTRTFGVRIPGGGLPQIWMTPVFPAKAEAGQDPSGQAFRVPFQDVATSNHIAQWTQAIVVLQ